MKKVTVLRDCDGQLEIEVPERIMTEQEAEEIKQTWDAINSELCGGGYIVRIEEDTNMTTSYREWKQAEVRRAVYNALAQVSMELDADKEEMNKAIEWFQIKFYEDGMCEEE